MRVPPWRAQLAQLPGSPAFQAPLKSTGLKPSEPTPPTRNLLRPARPSGGYLEGSQAPLSRLGPAPTAGRSGATGEGHAGAIAVVDALWCGIGLDRLVDGLEAVPSEAQCERIVGYPRELRGLVARLNPAGHLGLGLGRIVSRPRVGDHEVVLGCRPGPGRAPGSGQRDCQHNQHAPLSPSHGAQGAAESPA
jgi:hypothetical protein